MNFCPADPIDPPRMSDVLRGMLERLARRVEFYNRCHDETGDEKYLRLAAEADRLYLRARREFR